MYYSLGRAKKLNGMRCKVILHRVCTFISGTFYAKRVEINGGINIAFKNAGHEILRQVGEKSGKRNVIVICRTVRFTFAFPDDGFTRLREAVPIAII